MIFGEIYDGEEGNEDFPLIRLTPSPQGKDCLGNGKHNDIAKEIRCDECDYYLYCFPQYDAYEHVRHILRNKKK